MKKRAACLLVIALSLAVEAAAWDKRAVAMPGNPGQTCAMQETGQVGVSFNNVWVAKLDGIGREMDQRIDDVIALAKQAEIAKIEVQSYNYNVYPASSGGSPGGAATPYQYSGSVTFSVEPCSRASELMSLLASKGYAANLNVSAYRQCQ